MCKCDPNIRTPFCGKGECVWPNQKKPGQRESEASEMSGETAKVILDLCQALEKHLNKQPYHTKTSDDLAWEAGCKWLGNNAATPPGYEMVPEGTMKAIAKALACFDDLTQQSSGVSGLHQNGDLALWDELLHGGQYESWTNDIHALGAILKAHRATQKETPNAQG